MNHFKEANKLSNISDYNFETIFNTIQYHSKMFNIRNCLIFNYFCGTKIMLLKKLGIFIQ